MKNNNKKLIILVSVLLLGVGVAFAFFLGETIFKGPGANVGGNVATLDGATLEITGTLEFNTSDEMMYPGHKTVSGIKGVATGDNVFIPYNIIWHGTNGFSSDLKYEVYKSLTPVNVSATCEDKVEIKDGAQILSEECTLNNIDGLTLINSGTIPMGTTDGDIEIATNEFITATSEGNDVYYYVVIEYQNLQSDQTADATNNKTFSGKLTVNLSNAKADITILGMYVRQENGEYEEITGTLPAGNYTLNEQSHCSNSAEPIWDNNDNSLIVSSLTAEGTECEIYLYEATAEEMLAKLEAQAKKQYTTSPMPAISDVDTSSSTGKLYATEDNYGKSYVFRGDVQDNWVTFANKRWRIIRINGDGTLRLIYQCGTADCKDTTGNNTQINGSTNIKYNTDSIDNTYVGYYNVKGGSTTKYSDAHQGTNPSTIADYINTWYSGTGAMTDYTKYLSGNTGFCNDRQIAQVSRNSYNNYGYGTNATVYATTDRFLNASFSWLGTQNPDLRCGIDPKTKSVDKTALQRDLYTTSAETGDGNGILAYPVGLVTADEVALAGGFFGSTANLKYYLYTNKYYWTMSPYYFGASGIASVFYVDAGGALSASDVYNTGGVRPVINLKANITFSGGDGTSGSPFVVAT